ncbi:type VII toxin-antitoxin system MntA family adenylyltransferase antitoxin [Alicyclobacillus shizuokensis]|uniref:type VII toxin-antitoxin system MntA family adenylyltransferase antitoxin n=1 Tax=Alicyclobacillus shizuokensis TaxID=392014 RepID=UPI0008309E3F|nr:nucleotidyltransferase domain-containing protein [Alicyclobacillus shizuokensis]MCL6626658.1 nucleotidyltransferase domain-containing protein [Alicyclobacillus shizuokensis]
MNTLSEQQLRAVTVHLVDSVHPLLIYLFGSAAKERLRPDSDVDLAFLPDQPLDPYDTFLHAQELADLLKREVDLVDLSHASTVMQAEIVAYGRLLYERDRDQRCVYVIRAMKAYAMLNEERQCVLDRLKERGTAF